MIYYIYYKYIYKIIYIYILQWDKLLQITYTNFSPNFLTKLSGLQLDGFVSGWIRGFSELSFNISWKYRRIATPSPHECSKFRAAYPSLVMSIENDLSNHLKKKDFNIFAYFPNQYQLLINMVYGPTDSKWELFLGYKAV
jgi:hypothetical protein